MKILLVDDHALFRDGMRYVLQQLSDEVEILEAGNFADGLKLAMQHQELDLALMDLNMPGSEGAPSIAYFHQRCPHIPVVVVSGEEDRACMEQVMNSGAMGFISKGSTSPVMRGALNLVLSGGVYMPPQMLRQNCEPVDPVETGDRRRINTNEHGLTLRQMHVLTHMATGLSNKDIADAINLAEGTVKIHVAAIFQVLHVSSRMEAVRQAEKLGLISKSHG
jgi:DNA-binding NarL/FixJ family response regulator